MHIGYHNTKIHLVILEYICKSVLFLLHTGGKNSSLIFFGINFFEMVVEEIFRFTPLDLSSSVPGSTLICTFSANYHK